RANILEKKIDAEGKVDSLWISDSSGFRLSDIVSQSSHRIALSLLKSYPNGLSFSAIQKETSLPKSTAHNLLTGKKASVAKYFAKEGDNYCLSLEGLDWILSDVIPFLASQTDLIDSK
ncbi:MAG: helix-turn-helix domain-containing protein, partial [Candidatus Thorarchaeota archaeon]